MTKPVPVPSEEQLAIMVACQEHACVIVEAGPGCAKSTTARLTMLMLPDRNRTSTYYFAFNKDTADEFARDVPFGIKVQTFNSFGLSLLTKHLGRRPTLNVKKTNDILREIADGDRWSIAPEEVDIFKTLARFAKSQGWVPSGEGNLKIPNAPTFRQLCDLADVRPEPHYEKVLSVIINMSISQAFTGIIDFDDQVYMTALFCEARHFPKISWLFVDEAQDMSPLQLWLVQRCKAEHLCIVGDPLQAIYAFRGAMSDSFERIHAAWPDAVVLPLQTSYRLPTAVCDLLRDHNPRLTTAKQEPGLVTTITQAATMQQHVSHYANGSPAALLCRNNAPLYRAALSCIASHQPFNIRDNGWGFALVRDLRRVCGKHTDLARIPHLMAEFWARPDMTPSQAELVVDKITTIMALADGLESSGQVADRLADVLKKTNPSDAGHPLHLSTAHKAKGMEWPVVFHLDSNLIPSQFAKTEEDFSQEANIAYVLNSRAQQSLIFLSSSNILIPTLPVARSRPDTRRRQVL